MITIFFLSSQFLNEWAKKNRWNDLLRKIILYTIWFGLVLYLYLSVCVCVCLEKTIYHGEYSFCFKLDEQEKKYSNCIVIDLQNKLIVEFFFMFQFQYLWFFHSRCCCCCYHFCCWNFYAVLHEQDSCFQWSNMSISAFFFSFVCNRIKKKFQMMRMESCHVLLLLTFGIFGAVNQKYSIEIGNCIMDDIANIQPNTIPHHGYSYVPLYLYGYFLDWLCEKNDQISTHFNFKLTWLIYM